jgi:alginate O-acetyltransferase complex protein AlgI
MLLYSFSFFTFFIIVFILFWKAKQNLKLFLLLLASFYFYFSWIPAYLGILIISTLVCYFSALKIQKTTKHKIYYLYFALFVNLGFLFIFQYLNFFTYNLNNFINIPLPQFKLLLPIGISFFTLTLISYMLDVYKGKIKAENNLLHFSLFVSFFPKIIAGPIERADNFLPQLKQEFEFRYTDISDGAKLFLLGLFKKMVIADNLAIVVDRVFNSLPEYKGLSLIIVIILFSWQIYMDFSGYTDMARGVAKMLGINLLENFNLPYLSTSIQNFWKKWHISFSSWLKDYLYIPLGGSRKGLIRTIINTLIVFLISGLWHGASWTFIVWGLLHGIAISCERIFKLTPLYKFTFPNTIKILYAYTLVSIFWIFFRSPNLFDAIYILENSLKGIRFITSPAYIYASLMQLFNYNRPEMIITFSILFIAIFFEIIQSRYNLITLISKQNIFIRYSIYILAVFLILQLRSAEIPEFIYQRF